MKKFLLVVFLFVGVVNIFTQELKPEIRTNEDLLKIRIELHYADERSLLGHFFMFEDNWEYDITPIP